MSLDHRLLDLLVCPVCKGPLQAHRDDAGQLVELQCPADRLGFPVPADFLAGVLDGRGLGGRP